VDPTLSVILTALGAVGVSGLWTAGRFLRRWGRHHRFYRFQRAEHADFVLTTSLTRERGGHLIAYLRSTTSVGNMKASTELAQAIGYGTPRRRLNVSASTELDSRLSGDLIVIGLPGKNPVSRSVVEHVQRRHPELHLDIQESQDGLGMSLGTFARAYDSATQPENKLPASDLAIIIFWVNPFTVRKRRLILCGGFTTYGTEAAARYLVEDVRDERLPHLRGANPALASLWGQRWICFAMIVEVTIIGDQAVEVNEVAFRALDDRSGAAGDDETARESSRPVLAGTPSS